MDVLALLDDPLILIFVILFLGSLLGQWSIKGVSLGLSGVLLVAMFFGHFGYGISPLIQNFGLSLFIVSVGLQAGPRFFRMMKSSGIVFGILATCIVVVAVITTVIVSYLLDLSAPLSIGLMTGALTSTPGLATGLEATNDPIVSVGYGIAYPFGVIAVVLFVQLFPKILKVDVEKDVDRKVRPGGKRGAPQSMTIKVESDAVHKKTLKELRLDRNNSVVISRVVRGERTFIGRNDTVVLKGDLLIAVGYLGDLRQLRDRIGSQVKGEVDYTDHLLLKRITVESQELVGKSLRELNLRATYGVTVTRIERGGFEFNQSATWRLEEGDILTVVGSEDHIQEIEKLFGKHEHEETNVHIMSLSLILLVGMFIGMIPISIPGFGTMTLGVAGGPLFVSILIGHFGRLGPIRARFYQPATRVIRDIGLVLFLAGAGTTAGEGLVTVVMEEGIRLVIGGAVITILPIFLGFFIAVKIFHLSILHSLGALCGGLTSTPGLGAVNSITERDDPAIAYAAAYPFALILVAIAAQILAVIL
ncbi:aspartate:alanine exchanger family transporter [Texcoconibacillus texcoconensis]|uniref:Putative transport protein n=1 Tax=Texcoconibacillus texcoconensis TaxID=1095777 RepID=A0A840QLU8_9BACI|nr:TrkA C-terminal domain-containing protein [Texcoconibacillus texcoconensis]MBB5172344.1 putative transport protein [Texcoconibacillus texcoconensis]